MMTGSRLHAEIMNIPTVDREMIGYVLETGVPDHEKKNIVDIREAAKFGDDKAKVILHFMELAYKIGHRDARDAAAELALKP